MDFFGIGFPELFLILIVILIVVGPDKLPEVAGTIGRTVRKLKAASSELTREFKEMAEDTTDGGNEAERPINPGTELTMDLKEVAQEVSKAKKSINTVVNPRGELVKGIKEIVDDVTGVRKEISTTIKHTIEEKSATPAKETKKRSEDS